MRISKSYMKPVWPRCPNNTAMTLIEVVMSMLISTVAMGCMVSGYVFSINSAEKSALSLAATGRALERLEETRSARWDVASYPVVDQLQASNFPPSSVVLDVSGSGSGTTYATNRTSIFTVSTDPQLRGVRVECVWRFRDQRWVTNSVETVRAPD